VATVTIKKDRFKFFKQDHVGLGLALGALAPVLGFLIYYFLKYRLFTLREFLNQLLEQHNLITAVTSISLLANAVIFTLYINAGKDQTAKGIFVVTVLYGIAALLVKLIL
jgi:hypothetical protein